jgi:Ca2+-binding RTX toxin-like protein
MMVTGDAVEPNTIVVGLTPDGQSVEAQLSYPTKKGVKSFQLTVALSKGIRGLSIAGGHLSDSITIDQTNGPFGIMTHIATGNGNDSVNAGDESDVIKCGNGTDYVNSGQGNDTLQAGGGFDTLIGGDGNDKFYAGPHYDSIVGGNGTDTFVDRFGHNTIMGGTGHDLFILKNIFLDATNFQSNKDTFKQYNAKTDNGVSVGSVVGDVLDYLI